MRSTIIGSGRPALLIPGNDLAEDFYAPFAERLSQHGFSIRLLTLPGFQGTPRLPRSGIRSLLDTLAEQISDHCTPNGFLIGHSFGGLLALCLAAELPERIERLVLIEPALIPSAWLARRAAKKYRNDVVTAPRGEFQNWSGSFHRIHDLERFPRWAIDHYLEVRTTTDPEIMCALLDDLPSLYPLPFDRITAPTLLLRGASSGLWVRLSLARMARHFREASVVAIEGAAHWMFNEQDGAIVDQIIKPRPRI
jgi:pimeloyl-ACP methyl ester carboxylesterase